MKIELLIATRDQMPLIQNMGRFYAYDLSRSCGFYDLFDWSFPETGLYECLDFSCYWEANAHPFIIRVNGELAGFAMIDKVGTSDDVDWNMAQFFIVAKFQGKGVGREVAHQLFKKFSGTWEITQMPDNFPAISFWKKVVGEYTQNQFSEEKKIFPNPKSHENIVLKFSVSDRSY